MRINAALLVLVLATAASPSSHAENISLLSHLADGPSVTVAAGGNRAYLGHGGNLEILDVTDPSAPDLIGRHRIEGFITQVELSGDLAFVYAYSRGIHILDVSEPKNVLPLGFIAATVPLRNLEVHDSRLYYSLTESFHIVDVSDPSVPLELGVYEQLNQSWASVWGSHAYLGVWPEYLHVVNIEDPTQPWLETLMPGAPYYTYVSNLVCANGLMYVVRRWYPGFHNFRIYDLADPAHPAELCVVDGPLDLLRIAVNHRWLHFTTPTGFTIFDGSDPAAPVFLGSIATLDPINKLALSDDVILASQGAYGLRTFTAVEQQSGVDIVELGRFNEGFHGAAIDVDLTGNRLVVAGEAPGLASYDVTDPGSPVLLGSIYDHVPGEPDTRCIEMEIQGDLAFLRCSEDGAYTLRVVDFAVPSNPVELTAIPGRYMRTRLFGSVGFSRIGGDPDKIHVHDFTDPGAPEYITSIPAPEWRAHTVSDGMLLVAMAGDLVVFDVRDPQNPAERGRVDLQWSNSSSHGEITVVGNTAYVAMRLINVENEMRVVEFGDPGSPVAHAGPAPGDETQGIDSEDGFLYLAIGASGTEVYSLDNPLAPEYIGGYPAGYHSWNVNTGTGIFAVANSEAGTFVCRNHLVATGIDHRPVRTPRVLQLTSYPNPFNGTTRLFFSLASTDHVTLTVYNARGQRVRVFREGRLEAGSHSVFWDGRDATSRMVASGVYFARLESKAGETSQKLVRIR